MNVRAALADVDLHAVQQFVKWTVYTILVINFFFYVADDIEEARHALRAGAPLMEWADKFATTIDELAWFALLFLFELETYTLSDEAFEGWTGKIIHAVRLLCYVSLAHTVYAYGGDVIAYAAAQPVPGITDLCQLVGRDMSYTHNIEYWSITPDNCATLTNGNEFFPVDSQWMVTDAKGIAVYRELAWADFVEASVWLLIVFLIEFMVRLQGRGISEGPWIRFGNLAKPLLYGILVLIAIFWGTLGHWLYVWDEFIWIAGFVAIELNVAEWRGEMQAETEARAG